MDITTCVIDASALVEHIHEIKSWFQHGRLRLVVPICSMYIQPFIKFGRVDPILAVENITKLWHKQTAEPQLEDRAPRRNGRPSRERPAFDINPRVTLEFLNRIQLEQSDGPVHHDGLEFQQPGEEYSPWKGIELPPVRNDWKEERPATFAQAVRHQINIPNGVSGTPGPAKGQKSLLRNHPHLTYHGFDTAPAKAKLVARASNTELSPWKMHKMAPKSLPGSMPTMLRPLISYTLWRLYENSGAAGGGKWCTILTNDALTGRIAHELSISVCTMSEMRQLIASENLCEDRNFTGELEREFGHREPQSTARKVKDDDVLQHSPDGLILNLEEPGAETVLGLIEPQESTVPHTEAELAKIKDKSFEGKQVAVPSTPTDTEAAFAENRTIVSRSEGYPAAEVIITASDMIQEKPPVGKTANGVLASPFASPKRMATSPRASQSPNRQSSSQSGCSSGSMPGSLHLSSETNSLSAAEVQDQEDSDEEVVVFHPRGRRWASQARLIEDIPQVTSPAVSLRVPNQTPVVESPIHKEFFTQAPISPSPAILPRTSPLPEDQATPGEASVEQASCEQAERDQTQAQQSQWNHSPRNNSPRNNGPRNNGPRNNGPRNDSSRNNGSRINGPRNNGSRNNGSRNIGPSNNGPSNNGPSNNNPRINGPRHYNSRNNVPNNDRPHHHNPRKASQPKQFQSNQAEQRQVEQNQVQHDRPPTAIIDPDHFGRSSVVSIKPSGQNGRGRHFQNGSPRHFQNGSPRHGTRNLDTDVDYVVTSGASREATRGKGKLWIP